MYQTQGSCQSRGLLCLELVPFPPPPQIPRDGSQPGLPGQSSASPRWSALHSVRPFSSAEQSHLTVPHTLSRRALASQHVVDASPALPWSTGRHGNKLPSGPDPVACAWELERAVNFPPLESPTEIHEAGQKGEKITLIQ